MKSLLEVVVHDKCVAKVEYYKRCYIVKNENNNLIEKYGLEINAYIAAVEYGLEKGDGNCIAYYPNETITYKNYQMFCKTSKISVI